MASKALPDRLTRRQATLACLLVVLTLAACSADEVGLVDAGPDAGQPADAGTDCPPYPDAPPSDGPSLAYERIVIGTLGGETSWADAVDEGGRVVGSADTAEGERHAFLWDGTMIDLLPIPGVASRAVAINSRGQVLIGSDRTIDGGGGGGVWLWEDGTARYLGDGEVGVLSEDGAVAGARLYPGDGGLRARLVVWDAEGEHDLGFFPEAMIGFFRFSAGGQLLVRTADYGYTRTRVFLVVRQVRLPKEGPAQIPRWRRIEILGPGGEAVNTAKMNARARIVAQTVSGKPFMWENGVSSFLPLCEGSTPFAINDVGDMLIGRRNEPDIHWVGGIAYPVEVVPEFHSWARFLNNEGLLAGEICDFCSLSNRAAVWFRGRLIWRDSTFSSANAINERGDLAGNVFDPNAGATSRAAFWRRLPSP